MKIQSNLEVDGVITADTPTLDSHVATKSYVDNNVPDASPSDSDQVVLATQIFN